MPTCAACQCLLTAEEVHYYETHCEACERLAHERLVAWREGAHDPALDAGRFFVLPTRH